MLLAGTVVSQFKADITDFKKGIENMKKGMSTIKEDFSSVGNSFKKVGNEITSIFAIIGVSIGGVITGIVGLGKTMLKSADEYEKAKLKYEVLLGSQEKALERVVELKKFADKTPFELGEIQKADVILQGFGIRTEKLLNTIGDASAISGSSFADLGLIIGQVSQSKDLENIKQLVERGIISFQELENAGIKFAKNGSVVNSVEETYGAIVSIMEEKFGGGMEKLSQTLGGKISTLKDTFTGSMAEMGTSTGLLEISKEIIDSLGQAIIQLTGNGGFLRQGIEDLVAKIREWYESIGGADGIKQIIIDLAGEIKSFVDVILSITQFIWDHKEGIFALLVAYKSLMILLSIIELFKSLTIAINLITIAKGLWTAATWLLNVALAVLTSPITLVVLAIAGLIAIGVLLYKNWDLIIEKIKQFGDFLLNKFLEIINWIKNNWQTIIAILTGPIGLIWLAWQKFGDDIKGWFAQMWTNTKEWGSHMMENFVNGIKEGFQKVKDTISQIKNWITDNLGFSKNKYLPSEVWGLHFVENFSDGINKGMSQLNSGIDNMIGGLNLSSQLNLQGAGPSGTGEVVSRGGGEIVQNNNFYGTTIDDSAVDKVMKDGAWKLRNLR